MFWTCFVRRPSSSRSLRALRRHNLGARAPQSRRVNNRRTLIASEHRSCLLSCIGLGVQMAVIVECQDEQLHTAYKCCEPQTAPSLLDCLFSCFRAGCLGCIPHAPCGFPAGRACRPAAVPDCNCSHCCRSCFAACLSPAAASKLAQAASNGACCGSTAPDSQSTDTLHQAGIVDTDGRSSPWTTRPS